MTDEIKPVRCGCGGEATVDCYLGDLDKNDLYYVYCPECNIQTANYLIEAEAIQAWNRAMGERTVKVEDTWKIAGYDEINAWCPECEHRITRGCSYCPTCGVKLEWKHE